MHLNNVEEPQSFSSTFSLEFGIEIKILKFFLTFLCFKTCNLANDIRVSSSFEPVEVLKLFEGLLYLTFKL